MLKVSEQQEPVIIWTSKTNSHSLSGLRMRMNYCRKIFGTHLRYCGIESEMVNLLEGIISPDLCEALLVSKREAGYRVDNKGIVPAR